MLDVIAFSIASKKNRDEIDEVIFDILNCDFIPKPDKDVFQHAFDVGKMGNYPSSDYFQKYYEKGETLKSIAEIKKYTKSALDFYHRESLVRKTLKVANETTTAVEFRDSLALIVNDSSVDQVDEFSNNKPKAYSDITKRPETAGYLTGVREVDQVTNGTQPGTVAGICAFTSEGKSTLCVSSAYKNIKMGKKGVLFSLEVHPDIVWMQFQARYLFEEHNIDIRATELINQTLTDEKKKLLESHEEEYREFMENLLILDETSLPKSVIGSSLGLKLLYNRIKVYLGGLDFTIFDHVNQFELMFPKEGNSCIRNLTSAGKTFINQDGIPLTTIIAVQVNREGRKRAGRRNGVYDLQAISDLNEIERSCTYVIFMYTTEDMRITQETKMTIAKNRLGGLISEPVTVSFNPSVLVVGDLKERVEYADNFEDLGGSFEDMDDF